MARVNTNSNVLTRGLKYKNSKNKHKKNAKPVEEVTFDKSQRLEYLTGFHKRKLERQKNAQTFLKEQARLLKIEERRKLKFEREETVQKQLKEMKEKMKEIGDYKDSSDEEPIYTGEDDEWKGFSKPEEATVEALESSDFELDYKPILKRQTIYEDNTEVKTESIETNDNFEFLAKINRVDINKNEDILNKSIKRAADYANFMGMGSKDDVKLIAKKPYAEQASKNSKKKKFRYLTKNERKDNQYKAYKNKHRK